MLGSTVEGETSLGGGGEGSGSVWIMFMSLSCGEAVGTSV